uniref:Uncharacterized protein n=1 Tax=Sphaerodactylus townsendi TaxID=933632 RepID=A0ACB8GD90_9SAUR
MGNLDLKGFVVNLVIQDLKVQKVNEAEVDLLLMDCQAHLAHPDTMASLVWEVPQVLEEHQAYVKDV